MQLIFAPVSCKAAAVVPLTGKVAFLLSLIQICMTFAGVSGKDHSTCNACKLDWSHLSSISASKEVSWKRFPISSSAKVTTLSSVEATTHLSSFGMSIVAMKGVAFHMEATISWSASSRFSNEAYCLISNGVCFGRGFLRCCDWFSQYYHWRTACFGCVICIFFLSCQFVCFAFANSFRIVTRLDCGT